MSSKLEAKLQELRDELELLTSMVRAERLTATAANQQCTDEQGERAHKVLDQCIAFASVPQQDVGAGRSVPSEYVMSRDYSKLYDHINAGGEALGRKDGPGKRHPVVLSLEACGIPKGYSRSLFVESCGRTNLEWLAVPSPVGQEQQPLFTEAQVKAMVDDIKVIAAENAHKCYTNRIEQMTPPAPVAFHIDNYMWKKHGIKL